MTECLALYEKVVVSDMINSLCELVTASKLGCCYMQDQRPKQVSRTLRYRDRIENLPMLAARASYCDGAGAKNIKTLCYTDYCPDCQQYWKLRTQGIETHVAYVGVGGRVRMEPIQPGETYGDAMNRVVAANPTRTIRFLDRGSGQYKYSAAH